ncbi:uncharacterized protein [Argopecten irradians]
MSTSHPSPEWQSDNSLLACLQHLFDTRIGADVRFLIGERQDITMGHRSILICRSPVFCDILATQNPDPVLCEWSLKVTNTTTNIFDIFLRYLYTDYVSEEITESIAMALISLAQRYRVNTLVNYLKGILNNVQKTVPNSVKTSDSVSPQSNVTGRQFSALGRVWHSTCDNSMYLVNTGNRNPTQTSEGVVPVGRTEQGTNLHRNQDKTHTDHRNTVLVTDTENNRTMHFKVDEAEEDSETSENTPGNLTSDSHVRSPCDRKSESHTSDKDVDDTSQYMLNKRPIPLIKTEVEDDSFDHSVSSQGTGFPVGTNEDARFQLPLRTVSQTETMTSDIKEELPTEESMDTQTPSERDYTVTYSQDLANIQSGETTPAAGFKRKGRMRRGDNEVSGDNVMSGRDLYPAGLTTQHTETTLSIGPSNHQTSDEASRPKRSRVASEEELDARYTTSTKRNTQWGMKLFQDWNKEVLGSPLDMATVTVTDLAEQLRKFYYGVRHYSCRRLINIRGAINRHLAHIRRTIDIVRDKDFKSANDVLDGVRKQGKQSEFDKVTHKPLDEADLMKILIYIENADSCPVILRRCVWFHLFMSFVPKGSDFHQHLTSQSFAFQHDERGEYVTLRPDIVDGNLGSKKPQNDKRMYSCAESSSCPVKMLKLLLQRTDPKATYLFNHYNRFAAASPLKSKIWYSLQPLSKRAFVGFLPGICKAANVDESYTIHDLRLTAMQYVKGAGVKARRLRQSPLVDSSLQNNDHTRESYCRKGHRSNTRSDLTGTNQDDVTNTSRNDVTKTASRDFTSINKRAVTSTRNRDVASTNKHDVTGTASRNVTSTNQSNVTSTENQVVLNTNQHYITNNNMVDATSSVSRDVTSSSTNDLTIKREVDTTNTFDGFSDHNAIAARRPDVNNSHISATPTGSHDAQIFHGQSIPNANPSHHPLTLQLAVLPSVQTIKADPMAEPSVVPTTQVMMTPYMTLQPFPGSSQVFQVNYLPNST